MADKDKKRKSRKRSLVADAAKNMTVRFVTEGQTLSERYKLVEELGRGAMGVVFKAEDTVLEGMEVAIKVLPPELANDKRSKKRLRKETLSAIKLSHPNILRINGFEEDGGTPYIVMEYLDGHTVEDEAVERDDEVLTLEEVLEVAKAVCEALDYAHECGVVHRDIKPANLIYHKFGGRLIVKIADFGIAYQIKSSVARLTGYESSGTLYYAAPEQLRGEKPQEASDQYSVAATLYELLAGDPPFQGTGVSQQILSQTAKAIEGVPEHVNAALLKALSKSPEDRFASCGEFYQAMSAEPEEEITFVEDRVEEPESTVPAVTVEEQFGKISVKSNVGNTTCLLIYEVDGSQQTESLQLVVEGVWYSFEKLEFRPYTLRYAADGYELREVEVELTKENRDIQKSVELEADDSHTESDDTESFGIPTPASSDENEAEQEELGKITVRANVSNTMCTLLYYVDGRKRQKFLQLAVEGVSYSFKELVFRTYYLQFEAEGYEFKEEEVKLSSDNRNVDCRIELESKAEVVAPQTPAEIPVQRIVLLTILLLVISLYFEQNKPKSKPVHQNSRPVVSSRPVRRRRPVRKATKAPIARTREVASKKTPISRSYKSPTVTRRSKPGKIIFDVEPVSAAVYIDGFHVAIPKWSGLKRSQGSYEIKAKLAGHEDKVVQVKLAPGETKTVRFRFATKEAQKTQPVVTKVLFHGKKLANRYQIAQIVSRYLVKRRLARGFDTHGLSDVDPKYSLEVAVCVSSKIMHGYDGKFHGKRLINRYQMAVLIHLLLQASGDISGSASRTMYSDVSSNHWAAEAIGHVSKLNIMQGFDGKFHGVRLLNRYQLAVIFKKIAIRTNMPETEFPTYFDDVPRNHWAYEAVDKLSRIGLIKGDDMEP